MGILTVCADMVLALRLPKNFSVCELGDQYLTQGERRLAMDWYREIGCGRYESIDGNGRGTVLADLDRPLKQRLGQFDLVTDFGTGEHVFDQGQVWRTIHALTKKHGYIAFDRPAVGYPEHCFYLSNECLFRDIAAANNYGIVELAYHETMRGALWRGVYYKTSGKGSFVPPKQGRYTKLLRPIQPSVKGPDEKPVYKGLKR